MGGKLECVEWFCHSEVETRSCPGTRLRREVLKFSKTDGLRRIVHYRTRPNGTFLLRGVRKIRKSSRKGRKVDAKPLKTIL